MTNIIGVRFKDAGKAYYFDPGELDPAIGSLVVVQTARGTECGEVVIPRKAMPDEAVVQPLKPVVRAATAEDRRRREENAEKEKKAYAVCQQKIAEHKLDMKLVEVEYAFDGSKILFYFTADGRVDFRALVKDLAGIFRTRIELRQIGVRDEAKMLGGLGICGRPFCCAQFLNGFQPVSIKMAKEQGLSLNPTKISGSCGRLMCCLKYEQNAYESLLRITPKQGALVATDEGKGVVSDVNLLTGKLKVRLDKAPDSPPVEMDRQQVKVIRDRKGPAQPEDEEPAALQED
ncbi:MAG: PSP1 domain-containing protein [Acutalibacteraceae bacterium]|jgi:cell fate regulator YaaT (PSP1 superfamily)